MAASYHSHHVMDCLGNLGVWQRWSLYVRKLLGDHSNLFFPLVHVVDSDHSLESNVPDRKRVFQNLAQVQMASLGDAWLGSTTRAVCMFDGGSYLRRPCQLLVVANSRQPTRPLLPA